MSRTIIVHTASITIKRHERIMVASLKRREVVDEANKLRKQYPGRKVRVETIVEEVEL